MNTTYLIREDKKFNRAALKAQERLKEKLTTKPKDPEALDADPDFWNAGDLLALLDLKIINIHRLWDKKGAIFALEIKE